MSRLKGLKIRSSHSAAFRSKARNSENRLYFAGLCFNRPPYRSAAIRTEMQSQLTPLLTPSLRSKRSGTAARDSRKGPELYGQRTA